MFSMRITAQETRYHWGTRAAAEDARRSRMRPRTGQCTRGRESITHRRHRRALQAAAEHTQEELGCPGKAH